MLNEATVAIEDERFYKHKGVDYEGIIRAAIKNATEHKTVQGGSTLTMQLVRNLYTQDDTRGGLDGYKRKIREAKLARDLEEAHPKSWVLGKYLNTVPYGTVGGQSAIGAGAAARLYFNKRVQDLSLRPGRDARRHAAGAVASTRRCSTRAGPRSAATRCWARWPSSATSPRRPRSGR